MVRSMYAGVAGLRAHQTKMDVIGNNIANVNTNGFKAARAAFKSALYQTRTASTDPVGNFGGKNASQIGYGAAVNSIDVMHTQGAYAPTDSPLDCFIGGGGFFMTGQINVEGYGSRDGSISDLNLTRLGIFTFDSNGYLTDANRNVVYGFNVVMEPVANPLYINPNVTPDQPVFRQRANPDFDPVEAANRAVLSGLYTYQNPVWEEAMISIAVASQDMEADGGQPGGIPSNWITEKTHPGYNRQELLNFALLNDVGSAAYMTRVTDHALDKLNQQYARDLASYGNAVDAHNKQLDRLMETYKTANRESLMLDAAQAMTGFDAAFPLFDIDDPTSYDVDDIMAWMAGESAAAAETDGIVIADITDLQPDEIAEILDWAFAQIPLDAAWLDNPPAAPTAPVQPTLDDVVLTDPVTIEMIIPNPRKIEVANLEYSIEKVVDMVSKSAAFISNPANFLPGENPNNITTWSAETKERADEYARASLGFNVPKTIMRDNPSFSVNEAADVAVREDLYTIPRTLNEQIGVPVTDRVYPIQLPRDSVGNLIPLDNISVGADGKISGRAANGLIIEIGMIALANVPNPEALEMTNNSYYKAKMNTGEISAVLPGEETSGSLEAGGLEMSNVDLTKEFTDMITTQRGFQANSRIITVTDEMLLELVNMKR